MQCCCINQYFTLKKQNKKKKNLSKQFLEGLQSVLLFSVTWCTSFPVHSPFPICKVKMKHKVWPKINWCVIICVTLVTAQSKCSLGYYYFGLLKLIVCLLGWAVNYISISAGMIHRQFWTCRIELQFYYSFCLFTCVNLHFMPPFPGSNYKLIPAIILGVTATSETDGAVLSTRWYKSMNRAVLQSSVRELNLRCLANTLEIVKVLDWIWTGFVHGAVWKNEARWHEDYLLALLQLHDLAVAADTVQETQPWTLTTDGIFTQLACTPVCNTITHTHTHKWNIAVSLLSMLHTSYCFIFATILPETLCW